MRPPQLIEPTSEGVRWFAEHGGFTLKSGPTYLLELEWDGGLEHRSVMLDEVPVVVSW